MRPGVDAPEPFHLRASERILGSLTRVGRCAVTDRPLAEVRLLTVAEVAAILRLSKMTVYRMVNAGTLPALKVGRSVRIPEYVVDEYLRNSFVDTA